MSLIEIMPSVEVPGVPPTPYPFGLFSIPPASAPSDGHWQSGVWWQTAACTLVGVTHGPCTVDEDVPAKDPNVVCGQGFAGAFTVYAMSDVSTGGASIDEKRAQARDLLLAGEQWAVESVLWDLLLAATPAASTAPTIEAAIGLAEATMPSLYGGTPTLHMNRLAATLGGSAAALRVDGARLRSFLGSPVVAGGGYGDAGEDDLEVIASGGLVVIRSEVFDLGDHIDQATNTLSAVVERTYAVGWDCTAVRVTVSP